MEDYFDNCRPFLHTSDHCDPLMTIEQIIKRTEELQAENARLSKTDIPVSDFDDNVTPEDCRIKLKNKKP